MNDSLNSVKILLVEDNPADARLIIDYFQENCNIPIKHFNDGTEILDYLFQEDVYNGNLPYFIILDLNLPKVNGLDVLKNIKNDSKLRRIPVVVFGTSNDPTEIKEVYKNYATGYIVKPVDFDEFNSTLKRIGRYWLQIVKLPK